MDDVAAAILDLRDRQGRIVYGVATGDNTVQVRGAATAVTLPALSPVRSGDYCAVWESGADRLILGPVDDDWITHSGLSWAGATLGNGPQEAYYRYVPGGVHFFGNFTLGSTSSVSGSLTMTLPASLTIKSPADNGILPLGWCEFSDTGTAIYSGVVLAGSPTTITLRPLNVAGTYASRVSTSSTVPFTWTTGDVWAWNFVVPI